MKFDVSTTLQTLLPWELILTIGGVEYATRRPSIALMGRIRSLVSVTDDQGFAILGEMFAEPAPDFAAWDMETLNTVLVAYTGYMKERTAKNSQAIAGVVKSAMAAIQS